MDDSLAPLSVDTIVTNGLQSQKGQKLQPAPLPSPINSKFPLSRLDEDFVEYYNKYLAIKPATHNVNLEDIRRCPTAYASPWTRDYTYEDFVNDMTLRSIDGYEFPVRVYQPDQRISPYGAGPYPVHVNFHGGGFVFGDLTGDAEICLKLRNDVGMIVVDVNYRHCPEHTFGRGFDDCWAAIQWVHNNAAALNAKADSISIGGISAGGHIAAACQQKARDEGLKLKLAILAVPAVTWRGDIEKPKDYPYASMVENEFAPCLNWARMKFFMSFSTPKTDEAKAEVARRPEFIKHPIKGDLSGLCHTMVLTAQCDPIRDEGESYARKLIEAGVHVTARRYTGVPHPFMHMRQVRKAQMYLRDVCGALKQVHAAIP